MAYERNRLSSSGSGSHVLGSVIEYDPNRRRDPSGGWKLAVCLVLLVAIVVSLISARMLLKKQQFRPLVPDAPTPVNEVTPATVPAIVATNAIPPPTVNPQLATNAPQPVVADRESEEWAENSSSRSSRERALLLKLADAERLGRFAVAADAIEQLRARPSMADLDDKLARRLGAYNVKRLFSGEATPWTAETTVRRGQTVHRIAREHGTTVAAVRQLNGLGPREEPQVGRKLRILEFPKAAFVAHRQTRYADLMLNGRLFKRYYISVGKNTKPGAYPITSKPEEGPRSRFAALGIRVTPDDMLELDMFLAPGSAFTISEM